MTTIDSETLRKISQALMLLTDAQGDLEAYGARIPAEGGWADPKLFEKRAQREQQQAAMEGILHAIGTIPQALSKVTAIWEALGKPEAPGTRLLTWEVRKYNSHYGFAAGLKLFTIGWHSRSEEPDYAMSSDLPGLYPGWMDDSLDVLKATAEEELAAWLARVGGKSS